MQGRIGIAILAFVAAACLQVSDRVGGTLQFNDCRQIDRT